MSNTENILDGIYSELVKKDSELQKLDSKVNSLQKDQRIIKDLYSDIIKTQTIIIELQELQELKQREFRILF